MATSSPQEESHMQNNTNNNNNSNSGTSSEPPVKRKRLAVQSSETSVSTVQGPADLPIADSQRHEEQETHGDSGNDGEHAPQRPSRRQRELEDLLGSSTIAFNDADVELPPRASRLKPVNYSANHVVTFEYHDEPRRRRSMPSSRSSRPSVGSGGSGSTVRVRSGNLRALPARSTRFSGRLHDWSDSDEGNNYGSYRSRNAAGRVASSSQKMYNTNPSVVRSSGTSSAGGYHNTRYATRSSQSAVIDENGEYTNEVGAEDGHNAEPLNNNNNIQEPNYVDDDEADGPVLRRSSRYQTRSADKQNTMDLDHHEDEEEFDNQQHQDYDEYEDDHEEEEAGRYSFRSRAKKVKRLVRYDNAEPSDQDRKYQLRPRTNVKNYQVRIPLYGASPKKSERRRAGFNKPPKRFTGGYDRFFGTNRFSSSGMPGPLVQFDSDEEDRMVRGDHHRSGSAMGLDGIRPINAVGTSSEDAERIILNQRNSGGQSLTDSDPVSVENNIDFSCVGGLAQHVKSLKEMVLLPLMYPEVFSQFGISPPRGVIFHGPPGTGKTLVARALANVCSTEKQKIAFFMRKGADVLSKWVGESERQLKALFEQAKAMQPSIIFFDEIDGLAPVRSAKQDQIHSSLVTTLLALMDGLDSRGQVIVIGATNRLDAIDPALRRPGRFDREFLFPLPDTKARKEIVDIHTRKWQPPAEEALKDYLAEATAGYGGSDLKALVTEAALRALDRSYPHIYTSTEKLNIDTTELRVTRADFEQSLKKLVPSSYRWKDAVARSLPEHMLPLFETPFGDISKFLTSAYPNFFAETSGITWQSHVPVYRPRLLIKSPKKNGISHLTSAVLGAFEKVPINVLTLSQLLTDASLSPESAIVRFLQEARRSLPAVLFIPNLDFFWNNISATCQKIIQQFIEYQLSPGEALLILASVEVDQNVDEEFSEMCEKWFPVENLYNLLTPQDNQRKQYFSRIMNTMYIFQEVPIRFVADTGRFSYSRKEVQKAITQSQPPSPEKKTADADFHVPVKDSTPLTSKQLKVLLEHDIGTLRRLRMTLREFTIELMRGKDSKSLTKGINSIEDYEDIVQDDLQDILEKVEAMQYHDYEEYRKDVLRCLECFGTLVLARNEYYKTSNVYAMADIVEEWMFSLNRNFVEQVNQCSARWKKHAKEYQQLLNNDPRTKPYELQFMNNPPVFLINQDESEDHDLSLNVRTSRRLRHEEPELPPLQRIRRISMSAEENNHSQEEEVEVADQHDSAEPMVINEDPEVESEMAPGNVEVGVEEAGDEMVDVEQASVPQSPDSNENVTATADLIVEDDVDLSENAVEVPMELQENDVDVISAPDAVSTVVELDWIEACPDEYLDEFINQLTAKTDNLSVEALEKLRASILKNMTIWKHEQIVVPVLSQISGEPEAAVNNKSVYFKDMLQQQIAENLRI